MEGGEPNCFFRNSRLQHYLQINGPFFKTLGTDRLNRNSWTIYPACERGQCVGCPTSVLTWSPTREVLLDRALPLRVVSVLWVRPSSVYAFPPQFMSRHTACREPVGGERIRSFTKSSFTVVTAFPHQVTLRNAINVNRFRYGHAESLVCKNKWCKVGYPPT